MMYFEDLQVGQQVFVNIGDQIGTDDNGWLRVKISTLVGKGAYRPKPDQELVEVTSPWLECGWGMFDVKNLYPAPDFDTTYKMVDIVKRLPDNRTYEFGIGDINNADDPYYTHTQQVVKTGQRVMRLFKKCDGCGGEFPDEIMMSSSSGQACPDCYDRMSN